MKKTTDNGLRCVRHKHTVYRETRRCIVEDVCDRPIIIHILVPDKYICLLHVVCLAFTLLTEIVMSQISNGVFYLYKIR